MGLVRHDLETFVAQWQLDVISGTVYLTTWSQPVGLREIDRRAIPFSVERFRRDGFDIRELSGPLPVDLATWLHRLGAWEQLRLP